MDRVSGRGDGNRRDITLRGTVKAHSSLNVERQAEVFYCTPKIHNVDR